MRSILLALVLVASWATSALALPAATGHEEAICTTAPVIWCENFADRNAGTGDATTLLNQQRYKNNGWGHPGDNQTIVTSPVPTAGSKSLVQDFGGGIQNGGARQWIETYVDPVKQNGSTYTDLYFRFYVFLQANFPISCPVRPSFFVSPSPNAGQPCNHQDGQGTLLPCRTDGNNCSNCFFCTNKMWQVDVSGANSTGTHFYHLNNCLLPGGTDNHTGNPYAAHVGMQGAADLYGCGAEPPNINAGSNTFPLPTLNGWDCIEYHAKNNSANGVSDGILEGWVNGTQYTSYQGTRFYDGLSGPNEAGSGWNFLKVTSSGSGNVYPAGGTARYVSNMIISTQRIGCLGGAPPPTPPNPPSNLKGCVSPPCTPIALNKWLLRLWSWLVA